MPLEPELKAHIEAVLQHLNAERDDVQQQAATLQTRLNDLNHSISTISKSLEQDAPSYRPSAPARPANEKYANMSVRWAILDLLSDSAGMATAEIAEALIAGGVRTRAANFANNVSAVLSTTMKEQHNEVYQTSEGKWILTDRGKGAIEYIHSTPRFRAAMRGRPYFARI
jgi:hypothetical protein